MADEAFTVKVEGLDKTINYLKELTVKMPEAADRIIEDGGEMIFALSQRIVPVDTGMLQRSGTHVHTKMRSEVGYNTPYAEIVEFGSSKQAPHGYLRPAVEISIPAINRKIDEELKKL